MKRTFVFLVSCTLFFPVVADTKFDFLVACSGLSNVVKAMICAPFVVGIPLGTVSVIYEKITDTTLSTTAKICDASVFAIFGGYGTYFAYGYTKGFFFAACDDFKKFNQSRSDEEPSFLAPFPRPVKVSGVSSSIIKYNFSASC